ncbi:TauD/TfdA family dioxygenase [Actinomadura sp. WMMB 499]|uniref:TauD/TfdA family dioxygenase n=1 Tax=Actinomadura sp. WMMB 499 TaxID=1219491 RepID=UPI001244401E|nr:TauD/TfdA family dioxygenase [Actinomadura sp. WMMB 499]QFG26236.1 TauD/TfdA family dioxygenase [Actinomadura sp. WMMB 499]
MLTTTAGFGVVPARLPSDRPREARELLARDGAVILTGLGTDPGDLAVAAALVLGERLRRIFPHRLRRSPEGGTVHLHADSFDIVGDTGGGPERRRDPDEDHVLIQSVTRAASGGETFVADAYRFADDCAERDPELWEFLTGADVDLYGAWPGIRGLPATPRVARHIEYTRTGRRIVRCNDGAVPLHRDPDEDRVRAMLDRFRERVRELEPSLPRVMLDEGECLVLDNYRCWHGRDPHEGERAVQILTVLTADAR